MSSSQITYNPGILGESELVRSFAVRQKSLELILETLGENSAAPANRHLLIVGPRGIGKTMLVRRAAAGVKLSPELQQWYPLVFGEESYPVGSPGEFWLEALFHLADQTGDERIKRTFQDLREERDEARLRDRALAQLMDFADRNHTRILLVVENLNTLLAEQMDKDAAWDLRHTLLNEPRLMLLGTATNRLDEIAHVGHAWFEMFSVHQLQPLNLDECGELWQSVTGSKIDRNPLRAIRILTGGNPRLLKILAAFAANHSFRELMQQLVHLIDDHTEYFKGHLDALAPKERKVFVALLERWDPVTAADLAKETRLGTSEVSALLSRLCTRGAAEAVEQKRRKKLYQASERLYNIYYLMRRRGHPEGRVQAAVQFMVTFYEDQELISRLAELAREACEVSVEFRQDYYRAYIEVLKRVEPIKPQVLQSTPLQFFRAAGAELTRTLGIPDLFDTAASLLMDNKARDAEQLCRHLLATNDDNANLWFGLGASLATQERWSEAEKALERAIQLNDEFAIAFLWLGTVNLRNNRIDEAEKNVRRSIELKPTVYSWATLAFVLFERELMEDAATAAQNALELDDQHAPVWELLSRALYLLERLAESEAAIRRGLELEVTGDRWRYLGRALFAQERWHEAEEAYFAAVQLNPQDGVAWAALGHARLALWHMAEAEQAFRRAEQLEQMDQYDWLALGTTLTAQRRFVEAEAALRKGLDPEPQHQEARVQMRRLLGLVMQMMGPPERAESYWLEALQQDEELAAASVYLLKLRLDRGVAPDVVLREAEQWIARSEGDPKALSAIARFVVDEDLNAGLPLAENWARQAFEKQHDSSTSETLSRVLAALNRWQEVLQASGPMLDDSAQEDPREAATELMIHAAAAGYAKEALAAIRSSKGASALEPLIVGLQIFLGEAPVVAKEILEVANDVAERIRKCAAEATAERQDGGVNLQ